MPVTQLMAEFDAFHQIGDRLRKIPFQNRHATLVLQHIGDRASIADALKYGSTLRVKRAHLLEFSQKSFYVAHVKEQLSIQPAIRRRLQQLHRLFVDAFRQCMIA